MTVFPNKLKISLDSRSCKLEPFTGPKNHHQTVSGQWPILTWWDHKKDQKRKLDKKYLDCRSDVVGYFAGPASVLPDMSGRSEVIGKDWKERLNIKILNSLVSR